MSLQDRPEAGRRSAQDRLGARGATMADTVGAARS